LRTVRIRIKGECAFITIKGKSNEGGIARFEWEKEIDLVDAEALLCLCEPGSINKNRYEVPNGQFTFEVDEFYDENEGLIIAEIELKNENDAFELPTWIGKEVTGDIKYYNSALINHPFTKW
jgi:CYTH domain-containing protein